nr:polyphosphate polymerase domain-containing protein [uncultured Acetobacterium sp.]
MITKTFKRFENKYQLDESQLKQLMPMLLTQMKPDSYTAKNDGYSIYNIYFDTENYDIIRHSLSKPYYKEKLRLRSYKIPTSPDDQVFLELKKKIGGVVNKRRATLTLNEANRFISKLEYPKETNTMNQLVLEEIEFFLKNHPVMPKTYIGYQRIAFVGKEDPELRVTFDYNLKSRQQLLSLEEGDFGNFLIPEDQYLMEIKILGAIPLWLTHALSELQIYSTSFSKYGKAYKDYRKQSMGKLITLPIYPNPNLTACINN